MRKRGFFKWILLAFACACCGLFFACDSCGDGDLGEIYYTVQLQSASDTNDRRYSKGSFINEPQTPNKVGHTFVGWYNPATDEYWDFDKDVVTGDLLLVAHFKPTVNALVFESNDGEGRSISAPAQTGEIRYLPECPFQRLGYRFLGWGDLHDGAVKYAAGDSFEVENRYVDYAMTYTFYAIWEAVDCTVTFDGNGGVGEMTAVKMYPERYYALPEPAFTNGKLALAGWSYTDDGTVDVFNGEYFVFRPKDWTGYDPEKGFILYAVWEEYTDGLVFSCSGSRASVTGYTGTDKAVHIPTGYMGRRCEMIDLRAFKNNTLIESVTAGGCLAETHYGGGLTVSQYAFYGCVNLKRVDAARGVFSVLKEAFAGCTALQSFQFSADGYIDEKAFYGCTALQTVVWPQRLQELGDGAFGLCGALARVYYQGTQTDWEKITIDGNNSALTARDRVLFQRNRTADGRKRRLRRELLAVRGRRADRLGKKEGLIGRIFMKIHFSQRFHLRLS